MGKFPAQASTRLPPLLTLFSAPESGCRIHPSRPARREKGRKPDRSLTALLPLREKVSAKPTDEGPRRRLPSGGNDLAETLHRPLIRAAFAAHLLPQGEKGTRSASLHRPSWPGAVGERRFQPRRRRSGHRRADHQVIEPTVDDHRLV